MHKTISISILGLIGSLTLASCSNGGSKSSGPQNNVTKPSGDQNEYKPVFESCSEILKPLNVGEDGKPTEVMDILRNTKASLCNNLEDNLNKGNKPVNAFSSMWNANIQIITNPNAPDAAKPSFTQILNDGNFVSYWGVKDWITQNEVNTVKEAKLAFGEAATNLEPTREFEFKFDDKISGETKSEKRNWGIWDIRFVSNNGKVFKANTSGLTSNYVEEADLTEDYVKNVFAAFTAKGSDNSEQVYFLKKISKVDEETKKETVSYSYDVKTYQAPTEAKDGKEGTLGGYTDVVTDGKLSDLFAMIPEADIAYIDYVQKLSDNRIALFKKSKSGNSYLGYYLISTADLKNAKSEITFVSAKQKEITKENCFEGVSGVKAALCGNYSKYLSQNLPYVNAYSSMRKASIQLSTSANNDQSSFFQIFNDGKMASAWGVGDWIAEGNDSVFRASPKLFAFGEAKSDVQASSVSGWGSSKWGIWDVRFVDTNGDVLKAKSKRGFRAEYEVEAKLGAEYAANVIGAFILPTSKQNPSDVYFLKKDATYDVKSYDDTAKEYKEVSSGNKTSDLFPMIPEAELKSIDFVQKVSDKEIALFKKSEEGRYIGYYLVSAADVANNNEVGNATFVSTVSDK